jgi:hypothetical protein
MSSRRFGLIFVSTLFISNKTEMLLSSISDYRINMRIFCQHRHLSSCLFIVLFLIDYRQIICDQNTKENVLSTVVTNNCPSHCQCLMGGSKNFSLICSQSKHYDVKNALYSIINNR